MANNSEDFIEVNCSGRQSYRLTRSILSPTLLSQIFQFIPETVVLLDANNTLQVWNGESYFGFQQGVAPFTVLGASTSPQPQFSSPLPQSPGSSLHRPPTPISYATIPGASPSAFLGNFSGAPPGSPSYRAVPPPSGVRGSRRLMAQSPPPTATSSKVIKIFCTSRLSNGRPNKVGMDMVHVELTETNCSVGFINSKIQEKSDNYRDMVLCDSNGIPFPDDETTRQAAYWGFGRGQSSNAAKYYACKPREDDDDSSYEGEPVPKKMSLSDGDIARVGATEMIMKPTQCLGIALQPIVCKRCIDLWVRMRMEEERDVTCPKCRAIWQRDEITDEVTGYIHLKGFDEVLTKLD
uniref:Uncharacterized protein n=1 Tax=Plectus sambesii TaxID=2011161 RepID=A0A914VPU9_9BILA